MSNPMRTRVSALGLVVALCGAGACSSPYDEVVGSSESASIIGTSGVFKGLGGKCLDSGGTANGTRAVIWDCNGGANQKWTVSGGQILGPGGKCLDVSGGLTTNGTAIISFDCHGGANQQWTLKNNEIVGVAGKCVDVEKSATANGTGLVLWDCHGQPNQLWSFVANAGTPPPPPPPPSGKRDPRAQPFASNSIWNMPIGSGAVFAATNFTDDPGGNVWAGMPGIDPEHIVLRPTAPLTNINYSDAAWSGKNRCGATGGLLVQVPMPSDYIVPNGNANAGASFLLADGRTIIQTQPLARCTAGGPGTSLVKFAPVDLYGDGRSGAHGGSGLSSIGGSLRIGELRKGGAPPRHALKVNVDAYHELVRCTTRAACFRWPALTADSYATTRYGLANPNPSAAMRMGALLAIPSSVAIASLGFETEPAKMLAWTLQNYGAYIVDDTYAPGFAISAESGPDGVFVNQFKSDWGFALDQRVNDASPWVRDIQRIRRALKVVDNNAADRVGGGGTPLQPLAGAL
ncbi:MAG: hypothetical protein JWP87_526 [Labilithrix sp.]|nr:hypothetical protein [Labilithrix sp.]